MLQVNHTFGNHIVITNYEEIVPFKKLKHHCDPMISLYMKRTHVNFHKNPFGCGYLK